MCCRDNAKFQNFSRELKTIFKKSKENSGTEKYNK